MFHTTQIKQHTICLTNSTQYVSQTAHNLSHTCFTPHTNLVFKELVSDEYWVLLCEDQTDITLDVGQDFLEGGVSGHLASDSLAHHCVLS